MQTTFKGGKLTVKTTQAERDRCAEMALQATEQSRFPEQFPSAKEAAGALVKLHAEMERAAGVEPAAAKGAK